eukprot:6186184-Pleurochrysis_carterae.AAC.3
MTRSHQDGLASPGAHAQMSRGNAGVGSAVDKTEEQLGGVKPCAGLRFMNVLRRASGVMLGLAL